MVELKEKRAEPKITVLPLVPLRQVRGGEGKPDRGIAAGL